MNIQYMRWIVECFIDSIAHSIAHNNNNNNLIAISCPTHYLQHRLSTELNDMIYVFNFAFIFTITTFLMRGTVWKTFECLKPNWNLINTSDRQMYCTVWAQILVTRGLSANRISPRFTCEVDYRLRTCDRWPQPTFVWEYFAKECSLFRRFWRSKSIFIIQFRISN